MRSEPRSECPCCGLDGNALYSGLSDRLYAVPGEWSVRRCSGTLCNTLWLDPCPVPEDISQAYVAYYTHAEPEAKKKAPLFWRVLKAPFRLLWKCTLRPVRKVAEAAYRSSRFHDEAVKVTIFHRLLAPFFYLFPEKRARVDFSYMFLPVRASGQLLEIGFGSGKSLDRLARSGWSVEGIDFDEEAVASARKRGLPVKAGDLRAQCYPNKFFDAIVSSHAVEHLHDPKGFLQECWRILKPGGQLALMTPNAQSFGSKFFGAAWFALDPPRHLMIFSAQSLRNIGLQAGFSSAEARFNARDAHNVFIGSKHIADTGRHQWSDSGGLFTQLWGRFWQTVEWVASWLKPSLGEELVVVFRK